MPLHRKTQKKNFLVQKDEVDGRISDVPWNMFRDSTCGPASARAVQETMPRIEEQSMTMHIMPAASTNQIRVLIADDHPLFREALRELIETDRDFRVVGEANDGREAIKMVVDIRPDILLLDLLMPVKAGLETLQELSTMTHTTRTVSYTHLTLPTIYSV